MVYSEKEYKKLEKFYEEQIKELKIRNENAEKEVKLLKVQNKQKDEIIHDLDKNDYKGQCQTLKNEVDELKKKLKMCEDALRLLKKSLEKNSSNSCKPSSTDGYKRVVQNNRVKSGKKPGREKGHVRSAAHVSVNPDKKIEVSKVAKCTCGCKTEEIGEVSRDLISIKIVTYTTQYTGKKTKCPCCGKEYSPKFPKNLKSVINYDEKVKSLVVYLNSFCNVPNQKTSELLSLLSDGKIKMCQGEVANIGKQFSKKSQTILRAMKRSILKEPVINEDETPIKVNGKIMSVIGVFTKKLSITEAFAGRKLENFKEMGILDRYLGIVCHDHNNIHQRFTQSTQAECNFHVLRYCKAEYEVHKRESIRNFMKYLLEIKEKAEEQKSKGKKAFSRAEYEETKKEYLRLLKIWKDEFNKSYKESKNSSYYDSERCLVTRLKDYVDDHLRFITDFRIDFTNNLAERGLRKIKGKLKVAGSFRSLQYAKYYCDAISIIDTCKKQKLNILKTIENIFMENKKIFSL